MWKRKLLSKLKKTKWKTRQLPLDWLTFKDRLLVQTLNWIIQAIDTPQCIETQWMITQSKLNLMTLSVTLINYSWSPTINLGSTEWIQICRISINNGYTSGIKSTVSWWIHLIIPDRGPKKFKSNLWETCWRTKIKILRRWWSLRILLTTCKKLTESN